MLQNKFSITNIAKVIGKDKSVVSREITRNSSKHRYSAKQVQIFTEERQQWRVHARKFTNAME